MNTQSRSRPGHFNPAVGGWVAANLRLLLVALLLMPFGATIASTCSGGHHATLDEQALTLMDVVIDSGQQLMLQRSLMAFRLDEGLYLPLAQLMNIFDFPISMKAEAGGAEGWFLRPENTFLLDLVRCQVALQKQVSRLSPQLIGISDGKIYVHLQLIEQWFPVELTADFAELILSVKPLEPLPIQQQLERQARWLSLQEGEDYDQKTNTSATAPYRVWDWPFLNTTVETRYQRQASGRSRSSNRYKVVGAGDFMKMNAQFSISGDDEESISDTLVTLGRRDPDQGLLGALHASEYAIGDLSTSRDPIVAGNAFGRGLKVSNFPLNRTREFDQFSLYGELPLGWEAELYRNDQLIAFQAQGTEGRYDLTEIPLNFGVNEFRLVFYGPQGQVREKLIRRVIGVDMIRPGEHYYQLTAMQERDDFAGFSTGEVGNRLVADYEYGVSRSISVGGSSKSLLFDGERRDYLSAHSNFVLPGAFARLEYVDDLTAGSAVSGTISTRLLGMDITAVNTRFSDMDSERARLEPVPGQLLSRSHLRLGGYLSAPGYFGVGMQGELTTRRGSEGESREAATRLSLNTRHGKLTHIYEADRFATDTTVTNKARQRLLFNTRRGYLSLRGEVVQEIVPNVYIGNIGLSADWSASERTVFQLGVNRAPEQNTTSYSLGVNHLFQRLALGVNLIASDRGELTASLTVSTGFARDPGAGEWHASARQGVNAGAIAAGVFLDNNGNGVWDVDEPPVQGAALKVAGRTTIDATNSNGHVFVADLPVYRQAEVGLDPDSFDNPFWQVDNAKRSIIPRPGRALALQIPVTPTGGVEGKVFDVAAGAELQPVGNIPVNLLNLDGDLVRQSYSAYDGYYYFGDIPPGYYRLRAGPKEPKRSRHRGDILIEIRGGEPTIRPVGLLTGKASNVSPAFEKKSGLHNTVTAQYQRQPDSTPIKAERSLHCPLAAGSAYTVQLVAASSEASVRSYIRHHNLQAEAVYIQSQRGGEEWYQVFYGRYDSAEQARQGVRTLPDALQVAAPYIRTIEGNMGRCQSLRENSSTSL